MADPSMTFDAVMQREHFADFSAQSMKRFSHVRARVNRLQGIAYLVVAFLATLAFLRLIDSVARPIDRAAWLGPGEVVLLALMSGMLMALLLTWLMSRTLNAAYLAGAFREGGSYLGPRRFALDQDGISAEGTHGRSLTRWSAILEMTEAPQTYLLWTDPGAAVMVPKDAFGDAAQHAAFKDFVIARSGNAAR